jgi:hypothetical protein
MSISKVFKLEVFQGHLLKKHYFEGWYFKHVSFDQSQMYAFIPGISLSKDDPHSFIQVINGFTGETHYITYPVDQFKWSDKELFIQIGESVFTKNYINLNIDEPAIRVKGKLTYNGLTNFPKSFLSPGIMGWYTFVPFMECYHGVVSANHFIAGTLTINSSDVDFNQGKGYIEKDWGTSFPECWIWLQSNSFENKDTSLFLSVAKIPWLGKFFMGFIAFIYFDGRFHLFSTYNQSRLQGIRRYGNILSTELENENYRLEIEVLSKNSGVLLAPRHGTMNRRIKESIDSEVKVTLKTRNGGLVFSDHSKGAGLEIIETIFNYL